MQAVQPFATFEATVNCMAGGAHEIYMWARWDVIKDKAAAYCAKALLRDEP